jgi:hypothetical protein
MPHTKAKVLKILQSICQIRSDFETPWWESPEYKDAGLRKGV